MIGYVTLGTNNIEKALAFYDALFGDMGAKRVLQIEPSFYLYGQKGGTTRVAIVLPYDKKPHAPGNGQMLAMPCDSHEQVGALHAKVLKLGGTDEGAPGDRGGNFYAAYCRDLDGNKLCFFNTGKPAA